MNTMKTTALALRLAALLGTTAFFAASPVTVQFDGVSALPQLTLSAALASGGDSGGSDDGGNDGDGGGDGGGDDNDGGNDDDSGDDSSDDDDDDDDDGQGGSTGGGSPTGDAGQVTKIETSASGIEVTYADGSKEEIENGRYERKDSTGRTVEERAATQADFDRLSALF